MVETVKEKPERLHELFLFQADRLQIGNRGYHEHAGGSGGQARDRAHHR
jgi:hypothetical protein